MEIAKLKEIGLTENESKLYLALLELGPSQAGIISIRTGMHRRVVYDTVERLIKKGLIGYILKNNKKIFQASNPNNLLEILKEKENIINTIIPDMLLRFQKTKEKEETNFYKGKNGLKSVLENQLETKKELLIISGYPIAYDVMQFYFKWFDQKRVKNKIKAKIIFNKTEKKLKIPLSEIKFLPKKYFSPLAINIYGDKVAIILWSKDNPLAIVIKNKEIAEGYKKHFELMWRIAKK